jgi:hypothetical protein
MNNEANSCGQNAHAAKNILRESVDRFDQHNSDRHDLDAMPVHRGRTLAEGKNDVGSDELFEARNLVGGSPDPVGNLSGTGAGKIAAVLARIPAVVLGSVTPRKGEYDARRLRSQREIIRDVMLSAASCETWLTLGELRALTRYGEASISAQLRHLRKAENGGYDVTKRHREGASSDRPGTDGRGECVWEYRIAREVRANPAMPEARLETVGV